MQMRMRRNGLFYERIGKYPLIQALLTILLAREEREKISDACESALLSGEIATLQVKVRMR